MEALTSGYKGETSPLVPCSLVGATPLLLVGGVWGRRLLGTAIQQGGVSLPRRDLAKPRQQCPQRQPGALVTVFQPVPG